MCVDSVLFSIVGHLEYSQLTKILMRPFYKLRYVTCNDGIDKQYKP